MYIIDLQLGSERNILMSISPNEITRTLGFQTATNSRKNRVEGNPDLETENINLGPIQYSNEAIDS